MTSLPHEGIGQMPCQHQSRIFEKAFSTAEIARYNPVEQRSYEESLKVYRDLVNVVRTAERKGLAKSIAEGIEKGKLEDAENFLRLGALPK